MISLLIGAVVSAIVAGALHNVSVEAAGRQRRLLDAVIRLAVSRLPESLRPEFLAEWRAKLAAIFAADKELPLTRNWHALRYCVSLLRAGRSVGRSLPAEPTAGAEGGEAPTRVRSWRIASHTIRTAIIVNQTTRRLEIPSNYDTVCNIQPVPIGKPADPK